MSAEEFYTTTPLEEERSGGGTPPIYLNKYSLPQGKLYDN